MSRPSLQVPGPPPQAGPAATAGGPPLPETPRDALPDYGRALRHRARASRPDAGGSPRAAARALRELVGRAAPPAARAVWVGHLDVLLAPAAGPAEHGPTPHGPTEHGPTPHGPTEHGPIEQGPIEQGPGTPEGLDDALTELFAGLASDLPGATPWLDLGTGDLRVAETVLRAAADGALVPPGAPPAVITLHVSGATPQPLLEQLVRHAARVGPEAVVAHAVDATAVPRPFGVAPGHLYLPLGAHVVARGRLELAAAARAHRGSPQRFLDDVLPSLVAAGTRALRDDLATAPGRTGHHPPTDLLDPGGAVALLAVEDLPAAVESLLDRPAGVREGDGPAPAPRVRFGVDAEAAELGVSLAVRLRDLLPSHLAPSHHTPSHHTPDPAAPPLLLHAPCPPPARTAPPLYNHVRTLAAVQPCFPAGAAGVLSLDGGVRQNPRAGADILRGALATGARGVALAVRGEVEVRITGFLVRHGVVVKPESPRWGPR